MVRNLFALMGLAAFAAVALFALFTAPAAPPIGALIVAALVLHDMRNPAVGHFAETAIVAGAVLIVLLVEALGHPPGLDRLALILGLAVVAAIMTLFEVRERRAAPSRPATRSRPLTG